MSSTGRPLPPTLIIVTVSFRFAQRFRPSITNEFSGPKINLNQAAYSLAADTTNVNLADSPVYQQDLEAGNIPENKLEMQAVLGAADA